MPAADTSARPAPARRLAEFALAFKRKGRIEAGADADLLVFKLDNLRDTATYTDPYREASGWDWIIVGGEVVVEGGDPTGAVPDQHVLNTDRSNTPWTRNPSKRRALEVRRSHNVWLTPQACE